MLATVNFFTKCDTERKLVHTSGINLTGNFNVTLVIVLELEEKSVQITGPGSPKWGPIMLHVVLSFWVVLLYIVQINPVTPSPSHSATESQSFLFNIRTFPGQFPYCGFYGTLSWCPVKFNLSHQMSQGFIIHKNMTFLPSI
jgi:hypothetical protein